MMGGLVSRNRSSFGKEVVMRVSIVVVGLLALGGLLFASGCRTYVERVDSPLPSARYLGHQPQYVTPASAGMQPMPLPAAQPPGTSLPSTPALSSAGPLPPATGLPLAPPKSPQGTPSTNLISTGSAPSMPAGMTTSTPGLTRSAAVPRSSLVKLAALEEFALKEGRLTFNNFCLTEALGQQDSAGQAHIRVRGCFRNGDENNMSFVLIVVGVDEAGDPLWACNVAGSASGKDVGCLRELTVAVLPGTLRQTAGVRLRANVAPLPTPQGTIPYMP
jgi:hypothetical protein